MKKYSLAFFCILALTACSDSSTDSSTVVDDSTGGQDISSDTDNGDEGAGGGGTDGEGTDSGDGDTGGEDTDSGDGDTDGEDTDSGDGDTDGEDTDSGDGDTDGEDTDSGDDDTDGEDTDSGDGGTDGEDTDSGDDGTDGEDTDSGDGDTDGEDTDSGDDGTDGEDTSSCTAPSLGNIFTDGTSVLTDGCIDGDVIDMTAAGNYIGEEIIPGESGFNDAFDPANYPSDVKGLYLYTQGSNPGYIVPYSISGYYARSGSLGMVTRGPGVYYMPLVRSNPAEGYTLNGLSLTVWSATGGAVTLSEITWAHEDDDVSALPKMHWQTSDIPDSPSGYDGKSLVTLAASAHPLRAMTHHLSEDVVSQYKTLVEGVCPTFNGGFTEIPAVRFVDASAELGQAWTGTEVRIQSPDDFSRPMYVIAIDWAYASDTTVDEILNAIVAQDFLWPDPRHPNMEDGTCSPGFTVTTNYDDLRQQVLDGEVGSAANWLH